jgi:hypothetical protein
MDDQRPLRGRLQPGPNGLLEFAFPGGPVTISTAAHGPLPGDRPALMARPRVLQDVRLGELGDRRHHGQRQLPGRTVNLKVLGGTPEHEAHVLMQHPHDRQGVLRPARQAVNLEDDHRPEPAGPGVLQQPGAVPPLVERNIPAHPVVGIPLHHLVAAFPKPGFHLGPLGEDGFLFPLFLRRNPHVYGNQLRTRDLLFVKVQALHSTPMAVRSTACRSTRTAAPRSATARTAASANARDRARRSRDSTQTTW